MNLSGKTVFLTGGSGHLGRHLAQTLLERGASVQTVRSVDCDLRDATQARYAVEQIGPDLVIHAAAKVGGIMANNNHPYEFGRDNLLMGINIIDAAIHWGVDKLVMIGTTCSYASELPVPFLEDQLWCDFPEPTNAAYGIAKRTLGMLIDNAVSESLLECGTTCILANLYGPGALFDPESSHVIPAVIRKMCSAVDEGWSEVELWGSGTATRDFLHVRDAAEGIVRVCESWEVPYPVNLGSGVEVSIRLTAEIIADIVGFKGTIRWRGDGLDGQKRRALDTSRALEAMGWKSRINFRSGLEETAKYWRSFNAAIPS